MSHKWPPDCWSSICKSLRGVSSVVACLSLSLSLRLVNKQELIDAKVLVPILRNELEELGSREQGRRVMLVDGFPTSASSSHLLNLANPSPNILDVSGSEIRITLLA